MTHALDDDERATKVPAMSAAAFRAWMATMELTVPGAMAALGIASNKTIVKYRQEGAPLVVAYACAAIAAGLEPYHEA